MADVQVSIDADEVREVVDFYRRAAHVVGAAAGDLNAHDLGSWAVGEEYRELGERYREMGRVIADRLAEQARAADRLAEHLHRGMTALIDTDTESARDVSGAYRRFSGDVGLS
ncbi:hypothetical protein [Gordonia rhizosphera]|uniref:Uncharacterized protein n=1 Tax=Gordonia rhizosphera NBRC 16068 TaxID=1108045 RepID=K6VSH8_9ACTN|nr:hypothetical protein [Gordonia rhizosphera]GAB89830.1 hypothetical protein GORHZ_072_00060 [Gordonia rhizosphera NBRC 16068]